MNWRKCESVEKQKPSFILSHSSALKEEENGTMAATTLSPFQQTAECVHVFFWLRRQKRALDLSLQQSRYRTEGLEQGGAAPLLKEPRRWHQKTMLTLPFPFPSCLPLPFFSLLPQKTQARLPGRGAPPPPPDDRDAQPGRNAVSAAAEAPRGDSVGPAHRSAGLVPGGAADALAHEPQLELRQLESCIVVVAASHLGRFDLGAHLLPERAVVGQRLNLEARAGGQRGARGAA